VAGEVHQDFLRHLLRRHELERASADRAALEIRLRHPQEIPDARHEAFAILRRRQLPEMRRLAFLK
jgi:hypothetical protein